MYLTVRINAKMTMVTKRLFIILSAKGLEAASSAPARCTTALDTCC